MSYYKLTEKGKKEVERYIEECRLKRKEILDADKDTVEETNLPTVETIEEDINFFDIDDEGEYWNVWGVTDSYDADGPIVLKLGIDFIDITN